MTSNDSSVNRPEPATRAEATREPKGAGKRIRLWAIAGSSISLAAVLSVAITLGIQSHNDQVLRNNAELIELVRRVNEVMKKEASVIHDMASLPAEEQVQFWHDEFMPLAEQEHAFREQLLLVGKRESPERATQ